MNETLLIEDGLFETRAALKQNDQIVELQIERPENISRIGDFYHGRIAKILPDMNLAFVDLGSPDDGFLQLDDIPTDAINISSAVHEGEKLLVQVIKDKKGDKGLQLGCRVALSGPNLIYRPLAKGLTVSKSIKAKDNRNRLEKLFSPSCQTSGITVRTSAQNVTDEDLSREVQALQNEWAEIQAAQASAKKPGPIGPPKTPLTSILKNLFTTNTDVIVNNTATLIATKEYVLRHAPGVQPKVTLWDKQAPLFEVMEVEAELDTALQKYVSLPSGGNITIEPTEAAIIIDVNSAGNTRAAGLQSAALTTNIEAAHEICRQIRLRNLSGIIIIDFIQMNGKGEVGRLTDTLRKNLDQDPRPTRLIGMTELGLMQITRKRDRPALQEIMNKPCPACDGDGHLQNDIATLAGLIRTLQNQARFSHSATLNVEAGVELALTLRKHHTLIEKELARRFAVSTNAQLADFEYRIG